MRKEYQVTRDGFILTVMGFTGSKALDWKMKYIEAFNKMEKELKSLGFDRRLITAASAPDQYRMKQKEFDKNIADTNTRIDGISEIVSLNTNSWRSDAKH